MDRYRVKGVLAALLVSLILAFTGCSGSDGSGQLYHSLDEMKAPGTVIGVMTGTIFDGISSSTFPEARLEYYNAYADMAYLVSQGQLAGYLTDEPLARYTQITFPSVTYIDESLGKANYAFAFAKTDMGTKLKNEMNQFLASIRKDGTLEEIDSIWFGSDESKKVIDRSGLTGENGTIRVGTSVECAPFTYMVDGEVAGYEIDILFRFCREYGYIPEISTSDLTSLIPGLLNRYDMGASCITITEERKESIQFSDPDYYGGIVMVVKGDEVKAGIWDTLRDSFEKTFIRENPDWQFHPLTPDALPAVRRFNNEWCQLYDNRDDAGIADEHRAIELVFQHYGQLGLKGGYITAGGRIVAFSFGSPINDRVFDTHVEKALYDVQGAYNISGTWAFRSITNKEWWKTMWYEDTSNFPTGTEEDQLVFEGTDYRSYTFTPKLSGGLKNYFTAACPVTFLNEREEQFQEIGMGRELANIAVLEFDHINVNFSATQSRIRKAVVGFRILRETGSPDVLECTIYDYEPTDFLSGVYEMYKDYGSDPIMLEAPLRLQFVRVK